MGRKPKQYIKGQLIGTNGLIFVEEMPYVDKGSYKERKVKVICPTCEQPFVTDLRKITRSDTKAKKAVKQCQKCSQLKNNQRIADLGKSFIVDLTGKRFGKLTVIKMTNKRAGNSPVWTCKCDCGTVKDVNGVDLKRGHALSCGCMKSKGEEKISVVLSSLNIIFEKEKTFQNCRNPKTNQLLRFDFYLPDYNCCIEYDGEQHFEEWNLGKIFLKDRQFLDNFKNQYCQNNNIKIVRIPYWDYNKIDNQYILEKLGRDALAT